LTRFTIAVRAGDGIGPEVTAEAERVLEAVSQRFEVKLALSRSPSARRPIPRRST